MLPSKELFDHCDRRASIKNQSGECTEQHAMPDFPIFLLGDLRRIKAGEAKAGGEVGRRKKHEEHRPFRNRCKLIEGEMPFTEHNRHPDGDNRQDNSNTRDNRIHENSKVQPRRDLCSRYDLSFNG